VGSIALNLFIVMALLTLRLWELVHLALPMLGILVAQIALVWGMALVVFRAMGRDYDAAVMSGGFSGFMLGTSANAMACLEVLSAKYGPAPRAFLVVPIVGAFLIDFTNAMVITAMANWFR
jgi:glutamate:Na+ symporter, ESS family